MTERKAKLLRKYMGEVKTVKTSRNKAGILIRDQEEIDLNSSISSQNQSPQHRRVDDSDQQEEAPRHKEEQPTKSRAVAKGLRKALGLKKGDDVDEFISTLQVEGVDMKVIEQYLKTNREGLKMEKKQKKEKKKKDKEKEKKKRIRDSSPQAEKQESEGSDLVIPEHARTIHRDKQGRIKQFSEAQEKEMKQKKVMDRLAEWEKGMKDQGQADQSQNQKGNIWEDPARRWESTLKHPLQCPFQGYANRFNIKPGYRWDGVIRGNHFQNTYLQQINLKKVKENQEHKDYLKNL